MVCSCSLRVKFNETVYTGSMKLMLQKQDTAFACLTRFAVWVQDQVPIVECQVQSSCLKKIAAQTKLVQLWKELCTS